MIEEIKQWLSGDRNYAVGLQLYFKYASSNKFHNLFKEPVVTEFKEKKLKEVLSDWFKNKAVPVTVQKKTTAAYQANYKHWPEESTDQILSTLRDQWRVKYAEMSNLQSRIHDVALAGQTNLVRKQEASQMAARIVFLDREIREIYAQKSYYQKHGTLNVAPISEEIIGSPERLVERRLNLQRYLRTKAIQLNKDNLSDLKRVKFEQAWKDMVEELKALNKRLDKDENEGIPRRNAHHSKGKG